MRRLLIAITGGILIPLFLFGFTMMIAESLEHRWGLGWLANLLMFLIVGPMAIWERVFPSCPSCGLADTAIVATIVTVFLFYSITAYLVHMVIGKLRRRD
jgi:hypothetical protein